jgi:hypothetical protein
MPKQGSRREQKSEDVYCPALWRKWSNDPNDHFRGANRKSSERFFRKEGRKEE